MSSLVKICGLTRGVDIAAALRAGADYVGLVMVDQSPRHVDAEAARALSTLARPHLNVVVVLEGLPDLSQRAALRQIQPDVLQIHRLGVREVETARAMAEEISAGLWWAVNVSTAADIEEGLATHEDVFPIFDAMIRAERAGGWGQPLDWKLFDAISSLEERPFGLAGGLNAGNVVSALKRTGASLVDVSSGVEISPGIKDAHKMHHFVSLAKQDEPETNELSDR
jgi:phosphoribosylanthranilate isomerase